MQQSHILYFDGTLNRPEQVKALVSSLNLFCISMTSTILKKM